jgi:hypothetical protein
MIFATGMLQEKIRIPGIVGNPSQTLKLPDPHKNWPARIESQAVRNGVVF